MTGADVPGIDPPPGGEFRGFARRLTVGVVPAADASVYDGLIFGLTFDGYTYWETKLPGRDGFEICGEMANRAADEWRVSGTLPQDLVALRTCLFFEQRRWHHFGEIPEPGSEDEAYIRALVDAIRPYAVTE